MAAVAAEVRLEKYAELAVRVGANVQEGQTVFVQTGVEHVPQSTVRATPQADTVINTWPLDRLLAFLRKE